jgi:CRISPR/Cas system endoribonuclease Cas6 (RAMP superfamily)
LKFFKIQLKKKRDHLLPNFSSYDPQDFFSNDLKKVKKALFSLLATPQNNLKFFTNCSLVKDPINRKEIDSLLTEVFNED